MYWKIYSKTTGRYVERRWFPLDATAEEIYEEIEGDYNFYILLSPECDEV